MILETSRQKQMEFAAYGPWRPTPFLLFPIEVFVDATHVDHNLRRLGHARIDRYALVESVVRWFAKELQLPFWGNPFWRKARSSGTVPKKPVAYCRSVWCVTSSPQNVHRDDRSRARKLCDKTVARWGLNGFDLEVFPSDYCGSRLSKADCRLSGDEEERDWRREEKFVDVALATRLLTRGRSPDHPAGIFMICGDGDLAPALMQVHQDNPKIQIGVAGFNGQFSDVYKGRGVLRYEWKLKRLDLTSMLGNLPGSEYRFAA
ncbi:MAG: hypothetical protein Q8Q12_15085 [bacterium]|nr:hypothetical protein [bacterium]